MSKRKRPEHLSTLAEIRSTTAGSRVMFVDSGSGGTGWAVFDVLVCANPLRAKPVTVDVITSDADTWQMRIAQIAEDLPIMCRRNDVYHVVIEWPVLWAGSEKSHAAAASGKLLQLAAACGALIQGIHLMRRAVGIMLVTPNEWKGQLTKHAVDARIMRAIGEAYPNRVSDAVGMGLAVMGLL